MINIVLIEKNESTIRELNLYYSKEECIKILYATSDGLKGLNYVLENHNKIDIIIMDLVIKNKGGISILKSLKENNIQIPVIVCSCCCSDFMISKAFEYNIKTYLLKPYNIKDLDVIIRESFNYKISNCIIENRIMDLLHSLGIPSKYKGYKYLKDSIQLRYLYPEYLLTKDIYTLLAKKYRVSKSCIERAICRAIDIGFNRCDYDNIQSIFGSTISLERGSPTNLEYIETLVERLNYKK